MVKETLILCEKITNEENYLLKIESVFIFRLSDFHIFNILLNLTDKNIIKFTKTLSDAHPHPGTCTFSIIVLFWISLIFFIFFSLSLSLALFLSRPASVSATLAWY